MFRGDGKCLDEKLINGFNAKRLLALDDGAQCGIMSDINTEIHHITHHTPFTVSCYTANMPTTFTEAQTPDTIPVGIGLANGDGDGDGDEDGHGDGDVDVDGDRDGDGDGTCGYWRAVHQDVALNMQRQGNHHREVADHEQSIRVHMATRSYSHNRNTSTQSTEGVEVG